MGPEDVVLLMNILARNGKLSTNQGIFAPPLQPLLIFIRAFVQIAYSRAVENHSFYSTLGK